MENTVNTETEATNNNTTNTNAKAFMVGDRESGDILYDSTKGLNDKDCKLDFTTVYHLGENSFETIYDMFKDENKEMVNNHILRYKGELRDWGWELIQ